MSAEASRKYYEQNKDACKARAKRNRTLVKQRNKEYVADYLQTHPCVDCGITDVRVLQFDHKDRTIKSGNIGALMHTTQKLLVELEKCDVRCANCHMIRTAEQFGWSRPGTQNGKADGLKIH